MPSGVDYITVSGNVPQTRGISTFSTSGGSHEGNSRYRVSWDSDGFSGVNWFWTESGNGIYRWWLQNFQHLNNNYDEKLESFQKYLATVDNLDAAFNSWDDSDKLLYFAINHGSDFNVTQNEDGTYQFARCIVLM